MSRAERERWTIGAELWPHLQAFLSTHMSEYLFGETGALAHKIEIEVADLSFDEKAKIADECWAFMLAFKDRQDDGPFLRDGFGVHGVVKTDDRGRGQAGLARLRLVYDALAASLRRSDPQWRPSAYRRQ